MDQDHRYYGVYGIYYVGDESGQTADSDQRYLIRHLSRFAELTTRWQACKNCQRASPPRDYCR